MTNELKRARRELAMLRRHLRIMQWFLQWGHYGKLTSDAHSRVANGVVRDLSRQIKRQELECQKVALEAQGWEFIWWSYDEEVVSARLGDGIGSMMFRSLAKAVAWAEKQNKKECEK